MRSAKTVLSETDRATLGRMSRRGKAAQRDVLRARIILLTAAGGSDLAVAEQGLAGLTESPGRGRKPVLTDRVTASILTGAVHPPPHRQRWSCRSMAAAHQVSKSTVPRLGSKNDITPHLTRTFKVSNDPRFDEKFWDVIGLYLNPPDRALVLCCDEKSQCQAIERTQPGFPLGVGHIKTTTHDSIRHGPVPLFAALNYLEGKIVSMLANKHRHQEWLKFLKQIDQKTPAGVALHLIADNYATHKRFHLHFTPPSASWMNLVERVFRDRTVDVVERAVLHTSENSATRVWLTWPNGTLIHRATSGKPRGRRSSARFTGPNRC